MDAAASSARLRIRPMQKADLDQVRAIDRASFSMPWPESAYQYELLENPLSMLWVAEIEGDQGQKQVVGLIVMWLIVDEAHIATIAVHPTVRGRGIGSQLLAEALKAAIRKGMSQATLEVRANNQAAQKLYARFRFEVAGQRPHYYRDNQEDALIMSLYRLGPDYLAWLESGAWLHSKEKVQGDDS